MAFMARSTDPSVVLASLSATAARVNRSADTLSNALATIQQRLIDMALGFEAWVLIPDTKISDDEGPDSEYDELGFARSADSWALLTRHVHEVHGEPTPDDWVRYLKNEKPLLRSSRELRLLSVKALPTLLAELDKKAAHVLGLVEEAERLAGGNPLSDAERTDARLVISPDGGHALQVSRFSEPGDDDADEIVTIDVLGEEVDWLIRKPICEVKVSRRDLERALQMVERPESDKEIPF
jgi:hypothetical protein